MSLQKNKGFSLIELIMVLMIIGIISVILSKTLLQAFQTFVTTQNITETDWNGFMAVERISNEIHNIRSAGSITTISASNLVFTDMNGNSVQFQLSGNNLLRNSQVLSSGITSLAFTYSNQNGAVTATPSLVRYITISVTDTQGALSASFVTVAATRVLS